MPEPLELAATRLLWREQIRALPRSLRHALLRLIRRDPRQYLVDDATGVVLARFTSTGDCARFLAWLEHTHSWSFTMGKEFMVAQAIHGSRPADTSDPGPA